MTNTDLICVKGLFDNRYYIGDINVHNATNLYLVVIPDICFPVFVYRYVTTVFVSQTNFIYENNAYLCNSWIT
jgi:hypothetical protein